MMKIANITTGRVPREEPVQTLRDKGKGAFSTENRRLTWNLVVWPMLLQLNRTSHLTNSGIRGMKSVLNMESNVQI
jgi:hypothetical protein